MKSIFHMALLSLVIALVAGITTTTMVSQAFAEHRPGHEAQDDKNNPTSPGGNINQLPPDNAKNEHAQDNDDANCEKHDIAGTGGPPAQCY